MRLVSDFLFDIIYLINGVYKNFINSKSLYTSLLLAFIFMPANNVHALTTNSDAFYIEEAQWWQTYYLTFDTFTINDDGTTDKKSYGILLKDDNGSLNNNVKDVTTSYANSNFKISTSGSGSDTFTVNGQTYYITKANGSALNSNDGNPRVDISADESVTYRGNYINLSATYGGAFANEGYAIGGIVGDFISNSSTNGGALYNSGLSGKNDASISYITGDFIGNSATGTTTNGYGGAIYNSGNAYTASIGTITGNFIGNTANTSGGAIYNFAYNTSASITSIIGDFISNSATSSGGAIHNQANAGAGTATISSITGSFVNNSAAGTYGGAIANEGNNSNIRTAIISAITADFIGNSADYGGAISNYHGSIGDITGSFINNTANNNGGAIYSRGYNSTNNYYAKIGTITGDFISNSADNGGAIYNFNSIISSTTIASGVGIIGSFINNTAGTSGGAIYNFIGGNSATITQAILGSIEGDFIGNTAGTSGGAIYSAVNQGLVSSGSTLAIGAINGNFYYNAANGTSTINGGGAIYNAGNNSSSSYYRLTATIESLTGDFIGNTAGARGGAIYNRYGAIGDITGSFYYNTAGTYGGAIYSQAGQYVNSTIGAIIGDFVGNTATSFGGAIYNVGYNDSSNANAAAITSLSSDFHNNTAGTSGGAIYNQYGTINGGISGSFYYNEANSGSGGAIYNESGQYVNSKIGNIIGDFVGNTATSFGGAIYNVGASSPYSGTSYNRASLGDISGSFSDNISGSSGGAISNQYGTIGTITGSFYNNEANNGSGGAIHNVGTTISSSTSTNRFSTISGITGEYFYGNKASASGGAIYNTLGTLGAISSSFYNNTAGASGGAIYTSYSNSTIGHFTAISSLTGDFVGNTVNSTSAASGGAIYAYVSNTYSGVNASTNTIGNILGDFISNSVTTSSGAASGGAIYNFYSENRSGSNSITFDNVKTSSSLGVITGNFIDNYADSGNTSASGGAIYSNTALAFQSSTEDLIFSDNYTISNGVKDYNAIYFDAEENPNYETENTIFFNMQNTSNIIMNDSILANHGFNLYIAGTGLANNTFYLNDIVKTDSAVAGEKANVNINSATLKFGTYTHRDGTKTSGLDINEGTYSFTNAGLSIDYLGCSGTEILMGATINGDTGSYTGNLLTVSNINNGTYQLGSLGSTFADNAVSVNALQTVTVSGGSSSNLMLEIASLTTHSLYDGVMGDIIREVSASSLYGANSTSAVARFIYGATNLAIGDTTAQLAIINSAAQFASATGVNMNTIALNRSLKDAISLRNIPRDEEAPSANVLTYNSADYIGLWAAPMYQKSNTSNLKADDDFDIAYDNDVVGINFGIDKTFTSLNRYGIGFSTGSGTSSSTGDFVGIENEYDFFTANAYTSLHHNNMTLGANISYTRKKNELSQDLSKHAIDDLYSNLNSSVISASAYAQHTSFISGSNSSMDNLRFVPYVGLELLYIPAIEYTVKQDSTAINNAQENNIFKVETEGQAVVMLPVGVKLEKGFDSKNLWTISPSIDLGLTLAAGALEEESTVSAAGFAQNASLVSESIDSLTGNVGVSIVGARKNVAFKGGYKGDFSKNRLNHALSVQAQCDF